MRLPLVVLPLCLMAMLALSACGTMQPEPGLPAPRAGKWSLEFRGGCSGQEAETLQITRLDESEIVFDEFELLRNEGGDYVGSAIFIAPMPVDGRDIPYEISYRLSATEDGGFAGTETIVEGGGHGLDCPVELLYAGAD